MLLTVRATSRALELFCIFFFRWNSFDRSKPQDATLFSNSHEIIFKIHKSWLSNQMLTTCIGTFQNKGQFLLTVFNESYPVLKDMARITVSFLKCLWRFEGRVLFMIMEGTEITFLHNTGTESIIFFKKKQFMFRPSGDYWIQFVLRILWLMGEKRCLL